MASSAFVRDVTLQDFDTQVLQRSRELPVLVDFWAAWCGPCQMLMPLLAKLADEYRGKFLLAKVNTDVEQDLARQYGIRSLPTVKLFRNGQPVDGFMGVQPEKTIRALLDRYIARTSDPLLRQASEQLRAGRPEQALALLDQAAQAEPDDERVRLERARVSLALGQFDQVEPLLKGLSAETQATADVASLTAQLELARLAGGATPAAELEARLAADPANHEARFQLGMRRIVAGDYEKGMDELLEIVRRDRKFRDDGARKALLAVFNVLGAQAELVKRYRARLSSALN